MYALQTAALCLALVLGCHGAAWTYEGEFGPEHWGEDNPECLGSHQSPIDIDTRNVEYQSDLYPFEFDGYDTASGLQLRLKNNGHAAQVDIVSGDPTLTGGFLPEPYHLAQFHFHWGHDNTLGSEHTLNGLSYPMEVHFVHYAESRGSLAGAAAQPQGLAVLGFFFEIGHHNNHFDVIIEQLEHVIHAGSGYNLHAFALMSLLPRHSLNRYYRYSGSLTTPGCYESVIWTVFEEPIYICSHQMHTFRTLFNALGEHLVDNFRPTMRLNERVVHTSIRPALATAASGDLQPGTDLVLIFVVLFLFWKYF